ncbi:hypothetical protein, partial [Mesorhizobium sp. M2A.F.Ca.ET.037.01.1.1]|uniref:hypothetical protein n=1 Tax=Mesorhizobium sp. M2A.F.Ca.ET.037.01.1.1 TaxID=2496748 RepID=UPI001AEC8FB7
MEGDDALPDGGIVVCMGSEWQMMTVSSSTKTSLTSKRTILCRSLTSSDCADARNFWRKAVSVSARRRN